MEDLYIMATKSQGLTTQYKLKYEHIYLTFFSKMRVDLAAQVCFKKGYVFDPHSCITSTVLFRF